MSFAEFVAARDAAAWVQAGPTSPSTGRPRSDRKLARARRASARAAQPGSWQPAAPRYRRGRSPFGVLLGVLGVVSVGVYLAVLLSNLLTGTNLPSVAPAPLLESAATDLLVGASVVPVDDAATYQGNCQGDLGCWIWSVTARVDCPVATINAGFSDAADGANLRTATTQAAVVAEVPFLVVEHAATAAEQYAGIVSMTC
ncbi:hypothetical protein [Cryobacterium sp. SO1]|uniref:hypothetical protein n=1 Tax=Cryobacterium sp. SO1 TaxID=1897061 RepID=UPI001023002C|nr:hypothetical protein [Cryobacterium sp. SO1]RZI37543.1 hypothetical protein BJQ95_00018 [Cryobacterium sp. SO1]